LVNAMRVAARSPPSSCRAGAARLRQGRRWCDFRRLWRPCCSARLSGPLGCPHRKPSRTTA